MKATWKLKVRDGNDYSNVIQKTFDIFESILSSNFAVFIMNEDYTFQQFPRQLESFDWVLVSRKIES